MTSNRFGAIYDAPIQEVEQKPIYEEPSKQKPISVGVVSDKPRPSQIGYFPKFGAVYDKSPKNVEEEESRAKNISRWLMQVPLGAAQISTYPLDILMLAAAGDALDPDEIARIAVASEEQGIPFDENKYLEAVNTAMSIFPTQSNIERGIEEITGLPLQPKTPGQKALRLVSMAGTLTPGSIIRKATAGIAAPAISEGLGKVPVPEKARKFLGWKEHKIPEAYREMIGLSAGTVAGTLAPKVEISRKPSGLPKFRFEKLKSPKRVSPAREGAIDDAIETQFRKISNDIIENTPGAETFKELAESPEYKALVEEGFEEVANLAKQIPEKVSTENVKYHQLRRYQEQQRGITPTEYEQAYDKYVLDTINKTKNKEVTVSELLKQFRNNNKDLSGYFDPTKSKNINLAKRDAILDHNRAIVDVLKEKFPESEFVKAFEEQNAKWTQIKDAEFVTDFIDGLFDGSLNYNKAKKLLSSKNKNYTRSFERLMGKEGYTNFKQLLKDFVTQEKARKLVRSEKGVSGSDILRDIGSWVISPRFGALKAAGRYAKHAMNMMLDKPDIAVDWRAGIDAFKNGNIEEASAIFKDIEEQAKADLEISQPPAILRPEKPGMAEGAEIDITPPKPKAPEAKRLKGSETKALPELKPKSNGEPIEKKRVVKKPKSKAESEKELAEMPFNYQKDELIPDEKLPETIYHVTTNEPAINKSGILKRGGKNKGGLGGIHEVVSFTADKRIAKQIKEDILNANDYFDKVQTAEEGIKYLKKLGKKEGFEWEPLSERDDPLGQLKWYYRLRERETGKLNPVFQNEINVDPSKVGIIEVSKNDLPKGKAVAGSDIHLKEIKFDQDILLRKKEKVREKESEAQPRLKKYLLPPKENILELNDRQILAKINTAKKRKERIQKAIGKKTSPEISEWNKYINELELESHNRNLEAKKKAKLPTEKNIKEAKRPDITPQGLKKPKK